MGGFAGSFVQGLAGGIQEGQKQSMAAGLSNLQMQHLKATNKAAELALQMEQEKVKVFNTLTPEEQKLALFAKARTPAGDLKEILAMFSPTAVPGTAPPAEPLPFGGGTPNFPLDPTLMQGLPEQIAAGQVGGGNLFGLSQDDIVRGFMKKEFGAEAPKYNRTATVADEYGNPLVVPMDDRGNLDMSKGRPAPVKADMRPGVGPGMAPIQTPVNPYTQQPMGPTGQTGPPPTRVVETPTPGGGKTSAVVPLYPGGGGSKVTGTGAGGVRTELDLLDIPIPSSDVTKWSDGQGNNPPMGWTPRQAQGRGFKQTQEGMPAESAGKAVAITQAIDQVKEARALFFPNGKFDRSMAISVQMGLPEWVKQGTQTAVSKIYSAASAKLRIETGATARPEELKDVIARYVPSWKDNDKSASNKLFDFEEFLKAGKFALDPKGRIVVIAPPKVKKKPDLSLGKQKDPSQMTDAELMEAAER